MEVEEEAGLLVVRPRCVKLHMGSAPPVNYSAVYSDRF